MRCPALRASIECQRHVAGPAAHARAERQQLVVDRLPVERRILDHPVARAHVLAHFVGQRLGIDEVADPNAPAADLVLVGRTNATRGRANLAFAAARLAQHVELAVVRQDQVRLVADQQPVADVDAELRQLLDLLEQRLGIDHHAVADHALDAVMQDARGNQVQDELLAIHVHGMAGVVSALIPRHQRKVWRHQVDDLALTFVAELRAQDHDVHVSTVS